MNRDLIFSLDVGTSGVVGLLAREQPGGAVRVIDVEICAYGRRAIKDGQIDDIARVAECVRRVKDALQKRVGSPLPGAMTAIAGRSIFTVRTSAQRRLTKETVIDSALLLELETESLRKALHDCDPGEEESANNRLIGCSIVACHLDGYPMQSPIGHRCERVKIETLAIFLPASVDDSLRAALKRAGVEASGVTLEPIAALTAALPREICDLCVGLVDIGAGTSDIAVTEDGKVVTYATSDKAGDEITEKICRELLVEFSAGESIKIALCGEDRNDTFEFRDIFGETRSISKSDLEIVIRPAVKELAESIAERLQKNSGKTPAAVFLVGGGCRTPGLAAQLSESLRLPPECVKVLCATDIAGAQCDINTFSGPECVTPIGIAKSAVLIKNTSNSETFFDSPWLAKIGCVAVSVDGRAANLLYLQAPTVLDALERTGHPQKKFICRSGKPVKYWLNGVATTAPGHRGTEAKAFINGEVADFDSTLRSGDEVSVTYAADGADARLCVRDAIASAIINGKDETPTVGVGAQEAGVVELSQIGGGAAPYKRYADGFDYEATINDKPATYEDVIADGDKVIIRPKNAIESADATEELFDGKTEAYSDGKTEASYDDKTEAVFDGEVIFIPRGEGSACFADALACSAYAQVETRSPKRNPTGAMKLYINGKAARLTDVIRHGDRLELRWD